MRTILIFWQLLVAGLSSYYLCTHTTDIYYATEARHYSLLGLVSILFFGYSFFVYPATRRRLPLWVLSVIAVNTHFFFLLPVGCLFCFLLVENVREGWSPTMRRLLLATAAGTTLTIYLNLPSLLWLLLRTPDPHNIEFTPGGVGALLFSWLASGRDFYFSFCGSPLIAMFCSLLAVVFYKERKDKGALLFLAQWLLIPPLLLGICKARSDYTVSPRYLMIFLGLLPSLVLYGFEGAAFLVNAMGGSLLQRLTDFSAKSGSLGSLASLGIVSAFFYAMLPIHLADAKIPSKNFTSGYAVFGRALEIQPPPVIIHTACWGSYFPYFFAALHGRSEKNGLPAWFFSGAGPQWKCPAACGDGSLMDAVKSSGGGVMVVDERGNSCGPPAVFEFARRVETLGWKGICGWYEPNIKTFAAVQRLGEVAGIPIDNCPSLEPPPTKRTRSLSSSPQ